MRHSLRHSAFLAGALVGAYSLVVAGIYWRQRDLLYRAPRKPQVADLHHVVIPAKEDEPALHGWVDNPGRENALIYFGGSSEPVELRRQHMAQAFPNHTLYFIPYRGFFPNLGPRMVSDERAIKSDAERIFEFASRRHLHIDVLGRSLGTGVALHVAAKLEVRKLGLITPYDSILEVAKSRYRWLPVKVMLRDKFESWRDALSVRAPIFALLAETDPVTPHRRWENLKKHFTPPIGVATIPGTNHTNIVDSSQTWQELAAFFNPVLSPPLP